MPDLLIFCAFFQRLRGVPVILNIHDATPEFTQSKLAIAPDHIVVKIQCFLEKICIRFSSHVVTATESFKKKLVERGTPAGKITVICNFTDSRLFGSRTSHRTRTDIDQEFVLLYVGTVAFRYGLQTVVGALPRLRDKIPGIKLQVFTKIKDEGKALVDCLALAHKLAADDIFEVNNPVPLEQMPGIMANADIGVYPAIRDCHMDNALSLKIPEMVNMELPIVASRLTVLEELYGDDCIAFVDSGDVSELTNKIIELYESPEKRRVYTSNAKAKASTMSWESQYPIYKKLVEELISKK
jgi:glycosyltransferase involved in cell wall biosynthesis